ALEAEHGHRDLPAVAWLPDEVALVHFGIRHEDLAELAAPGHLLDAPDLDPGLLHVDKQEPDPPVRLGLGIGARQMEALLRIVGAARPRLLAVEHPFSISSLGPRAQAREVASRVRLA